MKEPTKGYVAVDLSWTIAYIMWKYGFIAFFVLFVSGCFCLQMTLLRLNYILLPLSSCAFCLTNSNALWWQNIHIAQPVWDYVWSSCLGFLPQSVFIASLSLILWPLQSLWTGEDQPRQQSSLNYRFIVAELRHIITDSLHLTRADWGSSPHMYLVLILLLFVLHHDPFGRPGRLCSRLYMRGSGESADSPCSCVGGGGGK